MFADKGLKNRGKRIKLNAEVFNSPPPPSARLNRSYNDYGSRNNSAGRSDYGLRNNSAGRSDYGLRNNSAGGSDSPAYSDYSEPNRITVKSQEK